MALTNLKRALGLFAFSGLLFVALAETELETHLTKQQAQYQADLKQATGAELIGQLLRLAAPNNLGDRENEPDLMVASQPPPPPLQNSFAKKQKFAKKPSKEADEKAALKRKWHELVDEIIDSGEKTDKMAAERRRLANRDAQEAPSSERRLAMILVKRKPQQQQQSIDLDGGQHLQQTNGLDEQPAAAGSAQAQQPAQQQHQQQQQRYLSGQGAADHARRILDDKFGILRHSIFSTNNQLGTKEVPKFGSEEQF